MDRLVIRGGRRIEGSVQICGAKNAALPQIAAVLLSAEPLELGNVPEVTDVNTMLALMREFGVVADRGPGPSPGGTARRFDAMSSIRIPLPHLMAPPDPERRFRFMEVVRRKLRERRYSPRTAQACWPRESRPRF